MTNEEEWDLAVIMLQVHGDKAEQFIAAQATIYDLQRDEVRASRFRRLGATVKKLRMQGGAGEPPSSPIQ